MSNPFIPISNANIAIIDGRVDNKTVNNLEKLNIKVIRTLKCNDVQESVSYHPDIVIHPINHNTLIIAPNVYDYYEEKLWRMGINIIKGETVLKCKYPGDIAYNVGRLKDIAIHNFKYTDEKLRFYLEKNNVSFVNVNQGYSKCSLLVVDDISGITADLAIYNKLSELGYNMLLIQPGYINLKNEKYGFIGGSSGNYSIDTIMLSGNLDNHPDNLKIKSFINDRNKKIIYLSNETITDIGTIITL